MLRLKNEICEVKIALQKLRKQARRLCDLIEMVQVPNLLIKHKDGSVTRVWQAKIHFPPTAKEVN